MDPDELIMYNANAVGVAVSSTEPITPLAHNSLVASFAMVMDKIARPDLVRGATTGQPYASTTLLPTADDVTAQTVTAAQAAQPLTVPVFGAVPRPKTAGEAQTWWDAVYQFLVRIAHTWQPSNTGGAGNPSGNQGIPALLVGVAADAAVPLRGLISATITEDPSVRTAFSKLYAGAVEFADRQARFQLDRVQSQPGTLEQSAKTLRDQLAAEYAAQAKRGSYIAYGVFGGGLAISWWMGRKAS